MEEIGQSLTGCHVVIVPAGVPRKPGMTRDDLFNTNASIVKVLLTVSLPVLAQHLIKLSIQHQCFFFKFHPTILYHFNIPSQ